MIAPAMALGLSGNWQRTRLSSFILMISKIPLENARFSERKDNILYVNPRQTVC